MNTKIFEDYQAKKSELDELNNWLDDCQAKIERITLNLPKGNTDDQMKMTVQQAVLKAEIQAIPDKIGEATKRFVLAELTFLAQMEKDAQDSGSDFIATRSRIKARLSTLLEERLHITARLNNFNIPLDTKLAEEARLPELTQEIYALNKELTEAQAVYNQDFARSEQGRAMAGKYGVAMPISNDGGLHPVGSQTWIAAADRAALQARKEAVHALEERERRSVISIGLNRTAQERFRVS